MAASRLYTKNEEGIWAIFAAHPMNIENRFLAAVQGRYEDAVAYADTLEDFRTTNNVGFVKKFDVKVVNKEVIQHIYTLRKQKAELLQQVEKIDEELKTK